MDAQASGQPVLLGVVCSENFFRQGDMGYGLVVTNESIIGAKKPEELEAFEAYLGPGSTADQSVAEEAKHVAERLRLGREFEVKCASIGQALVRRPSLLMGGYIVLKTSGRSIRVETAVLSSRSPFLDRTMETVAAILFEAVGQRLYYGKGDPVVSRPLQGARS